MIELIHLHPFYQWVCWSQTHDTEWCQGPSRAGQQSIVGPQMMSLDAVIFGPMLDKVSTFYRHEMSTDGRVSKADKSSFDESGVGGALPNTTGSKKHKSGCIYCEVGVIFLTWSNEWRLDFHETCWEQVCLGFNFKHFFVFFFVSTSQLTILPSKPSAYQQWNNSKTYQNLPTFPYDSHSTGWSRRRTDADCQTSVRVSTSPNRFRWKCHNKWAWEHVSHVS